MEFNSGFKGLTGPIALYHWITGKDSKKTWGVWGLEHMASRMRSAILTTSVNRLYIFSTNSCDVETNQLRTVCSPQRKCVINGSC